MENRFRTSLLDTEILAVTWELVPGRGAREKAQDTCLENARRAARGGKIHALTITDNPGGNPALLADYLGAEIRRLGCEPLVHFTCKDRNRNQLESQLYALDRAGVKNLLVISGDYPVTGFQGRPAPVFDLDSVHTVNLIREMNLGLEVSGPRGAVKNRASEFFTGVAVSPFKATEAEQMAQYFKLQKKVAAGAQFVVTQLGYDARKFHEVLKFLKLNRIDIPIMGNIFILPFGAGKAMNQNKIPGCVVTDRLLAELDRERGAPDKGEKARLLRAARMYAILKGMGFNGVHIGGHNTSYEHVEQVISEGEALTPNWPDLVHHFDDPIPRCFYFYERDLKTGLNGETPTVRKGRPLDAPVSFSYRLSRVMHCLAFEPARNLFGFMRGVCRVIQGSVLENAFHRLEQLAKVMIFDCKDCGDCALPDVAYSCPMSRCPKNQRNGACGGSSSGWCEVYPGKMQCIYVKAYARLKHYREEDQLSGGYIPPCNWDFYQTSSWINFYLGRDHTGTRLGLQKMKKEGK